jgi:hypothetical protein
MQTAGSDGDGYPCEGTYMGPTMRWKKSLTPTRLKWLLELTIFRVPFLILMASKGNKKNYFTVLGFESSGGMMPCD